MSLYYTALKQTVLLSVACLAAMTGVVASSPIETDVTNGNHFSNAIDGTRNIENTVKLGNTIFASSNNSISVSANVFTTIDQNHTLTCNAAAGCVVELQALVKGYNSTGGNFWAICAVVDGSTNLNPPCSFFGILSNQTQSATNVQYLQVKKGKHTVNTMVYMHNTGGYVISWEASYAI